MTNFSRITFGIIVLNGEPFVRYNLRAIYPFAHQIIVAEGASKKAALDSSVVSRLLIVDTHYSADTRRLARECWRKWSSNSTRS